ncbi:nucleotidyltransferase domain-containing protein [Roseibium sp. MB-4]
MNQHSRQKLDENSLARRSNVFGMLEEICQDLELTQTQFERAKKSYETVGEWLAGSDDPLLKNIQVYLQGSGALGTSTKPIGRAEFDVDLIGLAKGISTEIEPAKLKKAIGDRLLENGNYKKILEEKKRCWRLNYAGDFHLDISPTISNPVCQNGGELVPDRKLKTWHPTNPQAYKKLFERRAALQPHLFASLVAKQRMDEANVQPFPERKEHKDVLRRTVQLLKRHRDHHFLDVQAEIAPISVVITTLAMQSYEYCVKNFMFDDELQVLIDTIRLMPHFIGRSYKNGKVVYEIWNETTDGENFAERWNTEPERVKAFFEWHEKALNDFEALRDVIGLDTVVTGMQKSFGKEVVGRVLAARTEKVSSARKSSGLYVVPAIGLSTEIASAATPVRQNDFFGD